MMRIAVTGLIGSGKSEVMKAARALGYRCLSADEINAELLSDGAYISALKERFPSAVVCGKVDRAALSREVFNDPEKLQSLNSLAHPLIAKRIMDETASPLVVEVPLFAGTGLESAFDKVIFVKLDMDLRVKRLLLRGMDEGDIRARIEAQREQEALEERADVVIDNGGSKEELRLAAENALKALVANK